MCVKRVPPASMAVACENLWHDGPRTTIAQPSESPHLVNRKISAATMATLIEQIQRDCIDNTASVSALLRKVKLAASKLGVAQVEDWVEHELNGYTETVPDYRIVHGTPMAWCPYTGTQPILGGVDWLSKKAVRESIASLEQCLVSGSKDLMISFPSSITKALDKANGSHASYYLSISPNQLARIIDRVRTLILDWATKLEKAGVVGSDFSFSEGDKQKAQAANMQINIGSVENFTGNLGHGNVSDSIVSNAGMSVEAVRTLVQELRQYATELVKAGADATLDARIAAIEAELRNATPDPSKLRGLLTDVRNAISGAAGNIIASGVLYKIGGLLGA